MVKLDPTTGVRIQVDAHRADLARIAPIELDMEFAAEGGEGPTPYEVLLHAAMNGQSTRFSRQDSVEETWRVMQPLLDAPPPVESLPARDLGSVGRRRPRRRVRGLAHSLAPALSAGFGPAGQPSRPSRWSPTRNAFAIAVRAGFTAPMLGKKLVSTT